MIALGAAAMLAVLGGQATPVPGRAAPPTAPAKPDGAQLSPDLAPPDSDPESDHGHAWQHQPERPAQTVGPKLTPEMIDLCMEVAHDIDESVATKLAALRSRDERQFEATLRASRRLTALAELKKRDATLYDLKITELKVDAAVSRLATQARKARKTGAIEEARSLERQLEGQAILQLAFRYRAREDYLCRLRELVERLDREMKNEQENFDRVLADRMTELLADPARTHPSDDDPDDADQGALHSDAGIDVAAYIIIPE